MKKAFTANAHRTIEELSDALQEAIANNQLAKTKALLTDFLPKMAIEHALLTVGGQIDVPLAEFTDSVLTSLLAIAAENNAPDTARHLIKLGADVNTDRHNCKRSLLQEVLYYSANKAATVLIESGADLTVRDSHSGDTPLHYAVRHCDDIKVIALMLKKGADIFAANGDGRTPYQEIQGRPDIMKLFEKYMRPAVKKPRKSGPAAG